MIIEDPEAFKTWLTAVLKPICEADPGALAKYVIALVKKDKSPDALRQSMINQLEVFLQSETEPFVNQLFKTLETQDYITPVIPNTNPPNPNIVKSETSTPTKVIAKPVIPVSEIAANITETLNGKGIAKEREDLTKKEAKKSESDKDEKTVRRRSRHRSLSRNRSRSRSWDRTRRSRSREKSRERERVEREKRDRGVRSWRNKSPPRRYERRRSVSPGGRVRSRSRSPRHNYSNSNRGRYRNRSPPQRSTSRSRSRSGERRDRKDVKERDAHSGAATPTQDSNHAGDLDLRLAQSVQSAIVRPNADAQPGSVNSASGKRRCRDYDEKGFCMRGEMCPYDHGVDPVVLEDSALSRVLYPNGTGDSILVPPPAVIPGANQMMHMRPTIPTEYNPQAPQMWHPRPPGFRGGHRAGIGSAPPRVPAMGTFPPGPGGPPLPNIQRELIPVPVLDTGVPPPDNFSFTQGPPPTQTANAYHHPDSGMFKKKTFDYNRLGPRQKTQGNCSLELKKVPPGLNNITHLNNHFTRFGKIVNIQVYFEGDPEGALVTFSSHAEANAAYRSTEAVLNNRFIKVFWHSSNEGKLENLPPRSVKERLGQQSMNVAPNSNKVLNLVQSKAAEKENTNVEDGSVDSAEKTKEVESKKEEIKAQATLAIKKSQELLAAKEKLKKNQEEKRKEALKLTQDLRKRKQELLEKQLAQQKLLIEKMEKCPAGPQRELLMQTIKKSQESIEAIRKDLSRSVPTMKPTVQSSPNPNLARKSKEETQKELLDTELDLISKQAEGADTSELQKKLWELKARAGVVAVPARGRGRGARRFHPMNRHLLTKNNLIDQGLKGNVKSVNSVKPAFLSHAVDHRPTRLLVSGYESDEQDGVLTYFGQFGEIVDYVIDAATPSIVLNYKTRKEAEVALVKGKHFQDRTLSVTWCNKAQLNSQLSGRSSSRTVLISESDEDHLIDSALLEPEDEMGPELSEEALLQDDEEEEEENEDRSWRR